MTRFRVAALAFALTVTSAGVVAALPSASAWATATHCSTGSADVVGLDPSTGQYGDTTEEVSVCEEIFGSGSTVTSVQAWAYLDPSTSNDDGGPQVSIPQVHMALYRPNNVSGPYGPLIHNCATATLPASGDTSRCEWTPKSVEPTGPYCARGYQYWNSGQEIMAEVCVNVL
jgi:hypothetical protein